MPNFHFRRGQVLKILFQKDIIAEIKITELVDTKDKNRKSISNECYEIIKNGIENNVN